MASQGDQADAFLNSEAVSDDFFIGVIEKKLNLTRDKFKLLLVLLSPATGKSENYISVLYRVKAKIQILKTKEKQLVDFIFKALTSTLDGIKEMNVFTRERAMYEDVLISFEKIWLERTGEEVQFGPKCFKFETDPYEIIVLEDLKKENYQMLDRKVGLNLAQTKLILAKLAKFHAVSAIRYQKDGIIDKQFDRKAAPPPSGERAMQMAAGFMKMYEYFVSSIRNYGGCEAYADKISKWNQMKLLTAYIDISEPMRGGFQVLNHGDPWLNNMMFKFDEEHNPIDVKMVDYQLPFWGTPSGDLLYLLITSVADDVKVDHFDDLIESYQEELSSALKKLNFDQHIPTLSELHIDLIEKGYFGCFCLYMIMFVIKFDSDTEISIEELMGNGLNPDTLHKAYNNDIYKKALKTWLPFLNKRGFLDTLIVD